MKIVCAMMMMSMVTRTILSVSRFGSLRRYMMVLVESLENVFVEYSLESN